MYKLLVKLFIKDSNNVTDPKVRSSYGTFCGAIGIITNLIISVMKMVVGFLSSSIAILADGMNSLTDGVSSVVTLIAFKFSNAPADREHPFGHQRLEYVSGLIVSIVIVMIGTLLTESSIRKIISPDDVDHSRFFILVSVLIISILIKLWQGTVYKKAGIKINSKALEASFFDSFTDVLSTIVVLISLFITRYTGYNVDGYMGLVVSIFIILSGLKLIKSSISPLLGEAPNKDFVKRVKEKIMGYPGVLGIHDLVIHSYGNSKIFMTVHVEVEASVDVNISHDMIDNIEQDFLKDLNINLVIHLDPVNTKDVYLQELKETVGNIIKEIDKKIEFHDFRIVRGPTHTNILFDIVLPPQFPLTDLEIKGKIIDKIKEMDPHFNPIIVVDRNYLS